MQSLFDCWRKPPVGFNLVYKSGITTDFRTVKQVQERSTRWLLLICNIRMPCNAAILCCELLVIFPRIIVPVNKVDFRITLW